MICAMIHHMEKHLPHDEVSVFWFFYRLFEQHIVLQFCKIVAHALLDVVPVQANAFPIVKVSGRKRLRGFDASQFAEPQFIHAHEMNDLISNRPMRVVDIFRKLLMG